MKQLKKYVFWLFIGFISITLIYCINLLIRGVPGTFVVWNLAHNSYNITEETPYESLYVTIKLNGEIVFADSVHSDTWGHKSFSTQLDLGYNTIEIYSNELGIFQTFNHKVFFNSSYDITLNRSSEYFFDGQLVNLEEKEKAIEEGLIDDYNLKNHEQIYFYGINVDHSYYLFYPITIIE